jgi:hypothetical protein
MTYVFVREDSFFFRYLRSKSDIDGHITCNNLSLFSFSLSIIRFSCVSVTLLFEQNHRQ